MAETLDCWLAKTLAAREAPHGSSSGPLPDLPDVPQPPASAVPADAVPVQPAAGEDSPVAESSQPRGTRPWPDAQETPPVPAQGLASLADQTVIFGRSAFLNRLMDDEELAGSIVEGFLSSVPPQIDKLAADIAAGDCPLAERQAHKIKGAAATIEAVALRQAAAAVEAAGKAGDLPGGCDTCCRNSGSSSTSCAPP